MDFKSYSPAEIGATWSNNGKNKANLPIWKMFMMAIFAGMFIGFGAVGFCVMTSGLTGDLAILGKFIGACIFPCGLMLVVVCGAELFTGNCLLPIALLDKKITVGQMLKNWIVVYVGNIVGSYLLAYIVFKSGLFGGAMGENIAKIATAKASLSFGAAFFRGLLCNILVTLSLWFQAGSRDLSGKILAIFFPIMLFVLAGFEHSVANMFYLPLGQLCGAAVTTAQAWLGNILPVTLGNIVGGALFVAIPMYYAYVKKKAEPAKVEAK